MFRKLIAAALLSCFTFAGLVDADWPRFRGPNGSGVSVESQTPPTQWSPTENLKWKTALPGPGVSSPILVGERVFVTCYSGYGVDRRNPGEMENLKRHLICLERATGKILWEKTVDPVLPEDPYSGAGVPTHGYASHSPVSDGERVYVFFGKTGALAFDFDGNQLWRTPLGTESDPRQWGSASSPILHGDLLIVTASSESQAVIGLDTKSGKEVWRAEAAGISNTWATPVLCKVDAQRTDIVIGVPFELWGINPKTGKLRWYAEIPAGDQANSSVLSSEGIIYSVMGGRSGGGSSAVKGGGENDVTESHVLWTGRTSTRFGTPVLHDGRLYAISGSVVTCINAKTGETVYEERLATNSAAAGNSPSPGRRGRGGGSDYTSPIIAGGHLYYLRGTGELVVLKTGDQLEQIAANRVTTDTENFMATPAISDGQLFLRSDKHLYCVAETK